MPRSDEFTPERPRKKAVPPADEDEDAPRRRPRRPVADEDDEDHEGSGGVAGIIPYRNPKALLAYYCGIFGLIPGIGLLLGPGGIVLGFLGLLTVRRYPTARGTGHAIAGLVLGMIDVAASLVLVWFFRETIRQALTLL